MASVNKVTLLGNLGADPETRTLANGTVLTNLKIATSEHWKDKNTGEKKEQTEWHNVTFFGRQAELAAEYLNKGSKVYVEGSLHTRKWQDKNGNDRYTTEIKGRDMVFLTPRGGGQRPAAPAKKTEQQQLDAPFDDEIPFS